MARPPILFIVHVPPPVHGAALVGSFLVNSQRLRRAFDVRVVPVSLSKRVIDVGHVTLAKVFGTLQLMVRAARVARNHTPEIVFVTPSISGPALLRDLLLVLHIRLALGRTTTILAHLHMRPVANGRLYRLGRRVLLSVAIPVVLNRLLAEEIAPLASNRPVVLENGIPDPCPGIDLKVTTLKRLSSKPRILFLGHLSEAKGFPEVLRLARAAPHWDFDIAGSFGTMADERKFQAYLTRNPHATRRIAFHGQVGETQKDELFRAASALVLPSRSEAMPLVIIEALAYGVPVVATRVGAIPDMIDDTIGRVVEVPGDMQSAVGSLFQQDAQALAERCRRVFVARFSLARFEGQAERLLFRFAAESQIGRLRNDERSY